MVTGTMVEDCEMVEMSVPGVDAAAQVCNVCEDMDTLLLTYMKPIRTAIDYKTQFSGVQRHHLTGAPCS